MELEKIKNELDTLNSDDLSALIVFIQDRQLLNDYTNILVDALEAKHNDSISCPRCGQHHIKRDGHYKNSTQRYRCIDCGKTFTPYVGTILENTKLSYITWLKYLIIMSHDEDLRDCAKYAGVSLKCSFFMRHKILNALAHRMENIELSGIVELDEMSVNISYSGNHSKQAEKPLPRKPYKRGRKGNRRDKKDQNITDAVQIASAVDRNGRILLKVAKIGSTTLDNETTTAVYLKHLQKATTLCTDGLFVYRRLSESLQIEHYAFPAKSKAKRGIYHINHVNYVHSQIEKYMKKHNGISSKYLNEYLAYIAYMIETRARDVHDYFVDIYQCHCDFRRENYIGTGFIYESIALG